MPVITLPDVLLASGFLAAVAGLILTVGLGPASILSGLTLMWVGGKLAR